MKRKNNFNERNLLWWEIKRNVLCVCCRPEQMIVVFFGLSSEYICVYMHAHENSLWKSYNGLSTSPFTPKNHDTQSFSMNGRDERNKNYVKIKFPNKKKSDSFGIYSQPSWDNSYHMSQKILRKKVLKTFPLFFFFFWTEK